tara:strand:+ start:127 stop:834 length:708 start_codon:yes stop_codon:yes gene_type:complete
MATTDKKRPRSILEWSTKAETTHAYDEDFDDAVTQPKPTKVTRKPSPTKRVSRLQFAGQATADKAIMTARDNGPSANVVVVSLDWKSSGYAEAHEVRIANDSSGNVPYQLSTTQGGLGFDEFVGLFYSNVDDPGVGKLVAEKLLESEDNHVVVVDGTRKGEEYARLAALVAAHFYRLNEGGNASLWRSVRKFPTRAGESLFPRWQAVVDKLTKSKSETLLRAAMAQHYHDHLSGL